MGKHGTALAARLARTLLMLALIVIPATRTLAAPQTIDPELRERLQHAIDTASSFHDRFDAEVWLLDNRTRLNQVFAGKLKQNKRYISEQETLQMLKAVHREAHRAHIDPQLVLALIQTESTFDRFAISKSGALGLMQVMPFWLKELGHDDANLFDIDTNITLGVTILKYYLDKENGQTGKALARYNGSAGSWKYPNKVLTNHQRYWR